MNAQHWDDSDWPSAGSPEEPRVEPPGGPGPPTPPAKYARPTRNGRSVGGGGSPGGRSAAAAGAPLGAVAVVAGQQLVQGGAGAASSLGAAGSTAAASGALQHQALTAGGEQAIGALGHQVATAGGEQAIGALGHQAAEGGTMLGHHAVEVAEAGGALGHHAVEVAEAGGALGHQAVEAVGALTHHAVDAAAGAGAAAAPPAGGAPASAPQSPPAQMIVAAATAVVAVAAVMAVVAMGDDPPPPVPEPAAPTTTEAPFVPPSGPTGGLSTEADAPLSGNVLDGADPGTATGPLAVIAVAGESDNVGAMVQLASGATIVVHPDGVFDYDPGPALALLAGGQVTTDTFTYTVATDDGWTGEWTAEVTVTGPNHSPLIGEVGPQQVTEESTVTVALTATDPDGDALTFTLDGGPSFATIEPGPGPGDDAAGGGGGGAVLTLAPSTGDAGTHTLTITVTDDGQPAESAQAEITVEVEPEPGAPARVVDDLLALYDFDDGSGTVVSDSAGTGSPYNLTIGDGDAVTWSNGSLTIDRPTLIIGGAGAGELNGAIAASGGVTIEAWVTSADAAQEGPARIVSLSSGVGTRNATLAQGAPTGEGGDHWRARLRTTETGGNGLPALPTAASTVTADRLTHVVITRSVAGEAVLYVDGSVAATASSPGDLSNWDTGYRLMLANETSGNRPWLGTYHLVAVYGRALSADEVDQNLRAGT